MQLECGSKLCKAENFIKSERLEMLDQLVLTIWRMMPLIHSIRPSGNWIFSKSLGNIIKFYFLLEASSASAVIYSISPMVLLLIAVFHLVTPV